VVLNMAEVDELVFQGRHLVLQQKHEAFTPWARHQPEASRNLLLKNGDLRVTKDGQFVFAHILSNDVHKDLCAKDEEEDK